MPAVRPIVKSIAAALLAASSLAMAWLHPGTALCAVLGWVSTLFLLLALRTTRTYLPLYLTGVVSNGIAFHWLFDTIRNFGGFSTFSAALIYLFFVLVSSLQYCIVAFIWHHLPSFVDLIALRGAIAWVTGEFLAIRIFPWYLGHTQLAFTSFAQAASIAGAATISFTMVWVTESLIHMLWMRRVHKALITPFLVFVTLLGYGVVMTGGLPEDPRFQRVALIQANVSLEEKGDIRFFRINTDRYRSLTEPLASPSTLVIWPETVIQEWIPEDVGHLSRDPRLPHFAESPPMLIGALSYRHPESRFNSAFAVLPDGSIPKPYHKQILMPFGEYTPLANFLPFLAAMNSTIAEFTPGDKVTVFRYPISTPEGTTEVSVSPLICYEDVVPALARSATQQGAEVLVNMTNDAWFGNTVAPLQHHLIASFRAIENRRALVRATNTGLTGVVSPLGETKVSLRPFSEDRTLADVPLLSYKTLYTRFLGETPWWVLSGAAIALVGVNRRRLRRSKH